MDWLTRTYIINVNTLGNFQAVVVAVLVSVMILIFMWYFHRSKVAVLSVAIELTIALYLVLFIGIVNAKSPEAIFWLSRFMYTVFMVLSLLAIYTTSYTSRRPMPVFKAIGLGISALTIFLIFGNDRWFITRAYVSKTYHMSVKGPLILVFFIYLFVIGFGFLYQLFLLYRADREKFRQTWSLYIGMAFVSIYGNIVGIVVTANPQIKPALYLNIMVFSLCLVIFLFKTLKKTIDEKEQMMEAYLYDDLTGVYSRTYIIEEIRRKGTRRIKDRSYIAMVDLDGFKSINDHYGHMSGDMILKRFGALLKETGEDLWIAGRTGGDEFMIFIMDGDYYRIKYCLGQLMDRYLKITDGLSHDGTAPDIGMSIGLTAIRHGEDLDHLYIRADELLYEAKKDGKNSIRSDVNSDAVRIRA